MDEPVTGVPRFSIAERDRRWARVRALMAREGLDAIFAPPNTGLFDQFQANVRYLTGLGGGHCQLAAYFPAAGTVTAVTSPDVATEIWLQRQDWVDDIRRISTGWGFSGEIISRVRESEPIRRLGVTGLAGNTRFPEGVASYGMVRRLAEELDGVEIVNANALMEEARFVKSDEEIGFIRAADRLVEQAIDVLVETARPGVAENIVYARMIASMVEGGGELPSMILWSAGWPQPASNAYLPTRRALRAGDMILTEAEARWGGYIAQNTQPLFLGRAPDDYRDMFSLQQEAVALCYGAMRPGITMGELASRVAGLSSDRYKVSLLMHCRGLGDDSPMVIHMPRDRVMSEWRLEANSVFIVKPMVSSQDGRQRVYWGDTVVCTPDGAQRLGTRSPALIEID